GGASRAPARVHSSWSITAASAIAPEQLCGLILDLPETVVRAKGILPNKRRPGRRFLVQYDGTRCETSEVMPDDGASDGMGRLVISAAGDPADAPEAVTSIAHRLHGRVDRKPAPISGNGTMKYIR